MPDARGPRSSLKLGLIVPGGFDRDGREGVIPALVDLAGELGRRHEVHVFVASGRGAVTRHRLAGAHVHQIGDPWLPDPPRAMARAWWWWRLGRQLETEVTAAARPVKFDLLHAFWAGAQGLLAGLLARRLRLPLVLSLGGGEAVWLPDIGYGGAGSRLGRARLDLALRLATEVTAGSEFARSLLPPRAASRTRVIPLGITCADFLTSTARPPGPPWRLLHVGSINAVKDQRTLLEAFAEVARRLGDVFLDCVGQDTLAGRMQEDAAARGLASRVRFHGFLPQQALVPLYRNAHLLVLSSRYESEAVVVLEAAAAGLPTVGTAVGLLPTLAPQGAACVPPGEPAALADAICAVLLDEATRRSMGSAAQKFAEEHDVAWTARAFEALYRRAVGE